MIKRIINKIVRVLLPPPIKTRHWEYSIIFSQDDDLSHPSKELIDICLNAINRANQIDLTDLSNRAKEHKDWINLWPGNHYRLLAGFVEELNPRSVIEIGTASGMSALAMKNKLSKTGKITTFDIVPWEKFTDTYLINSDFDNQLEQVINDIGNYDVLQKYTNLFQNADIIFIDAAKDNVLEFNIMKNFEKLGLKEGTIIIFDDIRVFNMLKFWRQIKQPKIDLTSFGNWSGTGVLYWKK